MIATSGGPSVVIISDVQDREIDRVRSKLDRGVYHLASGRAAIRAILEQAATQPPAGGFSRLDLVGHSVEHCFLRIGDWILDESAPDYFGAPLQAPLETLRIQQIRLLGCSTAITQRSWRVIREIAGRMGDDVEVFGTRRLIDDDDYAATGFIGLDALAGSNHQRRDATQAPAPLDSLPPGTGVRPLRAGSRKAEHTCFAAAMCVGSLHPASGRR